LAKKSISAKKRARQAERRRQHNRRRKLLLKKTIKELKATKSKEAAEPIFKKAQSLIDKMAQKGIIHKNKAARLKSQLTAYMKKL
jgi:small subunit ribosomal protein S20